MNKIIKIGGAVGAVALTFAIVKSAAKEKKAIETVLHCAHEHIFGVLFWFIALGMLGALLYLLVLRLQ